MFETELNPLQQILYTILFCLHVLLFGMSVILSFIRYKLQRNPFYTTMLEQWTPIFPFLFTIYIMLQCLILYIILPKLFSSVTSIAILLSIVFTAIILVFSLLIYTTKKRIPPLALYLCSFLIILANDSLFLYFKEQYPDSRSPHYFMETNFLSLNLALCSFAIASSFYFLLSIIKRKSILEPEYKLFVFKFCTKISLKALATLIFLFLLRFFLIFRFSHIDNGIMLIYMFMYALVRTSPLLFIMPFYFMLRSLLKTDKDPFQYKSTLPLIITLLLLLLLFVAVEILLFLNFLRIVA